ncbi:MAG: nicotinate-nucleotide adenylyltransferase [Clostridiales bacterium]|nr:nicotinate-nucleotide adenylyltransferase [Clostridiales bacterium]
MIKKIGIMGGSFDPVHTGHLLIAERVSESLGLDKVLFIPAARQPFKDEGAFAEFNDRLAMVCLAISDNEFFEGSDIEGQREGKSYSIDTVKELLKIYPEGTEFYFIVGADSLAELDKWKKADKLFKLCSFAAVGRPGFKEKKVAERIKFLEDNFGADIKYIESPRLNISSTDIREKIKSGSSVKYMTPDCVVKYIEEKGLYGCKKEPFPEGKAIKRRLRTELKESRYIHTLGVAETSAELAKIFGEDEKKAYIAGLLHDCAKNFDREKTFALCEKYGVELDEVLKSQPDLIHPFLGSAVAKYEYGIEDSDILNAIKYHTTGRADMSSLEIIVYLADMIEPNRTPYEGLDKIRKLAYYDLKSAIAEALNQTIYFNRGKKDRAIHPLSLEAYEFYKKTKQEEQI